MSHVIKTKYYKYKYANNIAVASYIVNIIHYYLINYAMYVVVVYSMLLLVPHVYYHEIKFSAI